MAFASSIRKGRRSVSWYHKRERKAQQQADQNKQAVANSK